jgi:vacuolar-type H+-ATPase subunit H
MEDQDTLQHLLEVEKKASELVLEAQKTADARLAQGERELREHCETLYEKSRKHSEEERLSELAHIDEQHQHALEVWKIELEKLPFHYTQFENLVRSLISLEHTGD